MKKITFLLSFILCAVLANAQILLTEDFNYAIGSDIKSQGWPIHSGSGATKDSILVVEGLTFSGYAGSGIGGAASVTGRYCDQNKAFTGQTSGTVYASFMLKSLQANAGSSYFLHFGPSTIGTTYFSRLWISADGTGLGIGASTPTSFTTIALNTTYLVVLKYDFTSKTSSFYLFSSTPTTEPTSANGTYLETTGPAAATATDLGTIALRQGQTSSVANQNIIVDGIRVAKSWNSIFNNTGLNTPSSEQLNLTFYNNQLSITNAPSTTVEIFNTVGAKVKSLVLVNNQANLNLAKGVYIVRCGNATGKIMM